MSHRLNGDLLGFKFGSWAGGLGVRFIAKWPETIPAGPTSLRSGPWISIAAQGSGGFGNGLGELAFTAQITSDGDRQEKTAPMRRKSIASISNPIRNSSET